MAKKIMIQCATVVNRDAVRRETIDGIEHIVITSMTLPGDIVMNGGLYPASEIDKSFHTLERTLAPIEHPKDVEGNFIPAKDPIAIHNFHAGAFNTNVKKVGNRVQIDKVINVQEALKTERGKRLLDRINELETNESPRPIHTSTGLFIKNIEVLGEVKTNAQGQEYDWVAHNMLFDHDAILLDSVAAATPNQGVGMAVNKDVEYEVQTHILEAIKNNGEHDLSMDERQRKVSDALENIGLDVSFIEELFDEEVIFHAEKGLFTVPYRIDDNDIVTIVGIPVPVDRVVSFEPKVNTNEGEIMKELIINALKKAEIEIDGLDDDQLFEKYNELQLKVNQEPGDDKDGDKDGDEAQNALVKELGGASIVANTLNELKMLSDRLTSLEMNLNAQGDAELGKYADIVANSGNYPGLDAKSAKVLGLEKLKEMAASCGHAFGVSPIVNTQTDDIYTVSSKMPGEK